MSRKKDINSAKAIAVRYIASAPRSIMEVESRLKGKGIKDDSIKETLQYLTDLGYLNDEVFANQWAGSKIKSRLWGRNRVIHDLKQKGISEEIIKLAIADLATSELDTAKLALEKWLKGKVRSKEKTKQRAFRHLQSKGFTAEVIFAVIKQYFGASEINESE